MAHGSVVNTTHKKKTKGKIGLVENAKKSTDRVDPTKEGGKHTVEYGAFEMEMDHMVIVVTTTIGGIMGNLKGATSLLENTNNSLHESADAAEDISGTVTDKDNDGTSIVSFAPYGPGPVSRTYALTRAGTV